MLAFTSPRFTLSRFTSPRFTSPRFTSPRFTSPRFTSPVQSSPVQSTEYSTPQIWWCVNQPFILFIQQIWGETLLFIIQTSDRMRYFTIFQDKLHLVNFQDDPNRGLLAKPFKYFQNHPCGQPVLISSASWRSDRVFEWTLIELRFNIITNLLLLFFVI